MVSRRPGVTIGVPVYNGGTLLEEAMTAGELQSCDTAALASALQGVAAGSLLNWAIHRDGTVVDWVRRDVETVISPYARGR